MTSAGKRPFIKMHGLGNDFAIFDARQDDFSLETLQVKALGDRHTGIGFDQCVILRKSDKADVYMEMWNNDGSRCGACGNVTRCVADRIMLETGKDTCLIETQAGILGAKHQGDQITVDMGAVDFRWERVPLFHKVDTKAVDLGLPDIPPATCLSVGNPHAVFFVSNVMTIPLDEIGPAIEQHWMFPERVNASFVEMREDHMRVRVWERGAGITRACGTAACAAVAAATRTGRADRKGAVVLDGGTLNILIREDGHALMTGAASFVYEGDVLIPQPELFEL